MLMYAVTIPLLSQLWLGSCSADANPQTLRFHRTLTFWCLETLCPLSLLPRGMTVLAWLRASVAGAWQDNE